MVNMLLGPSSLMFFASSIGSFCNLLYNLICVRFLSFTDYAGLNAILSLIVIITTPFASLTTLTAKHSSDLSARSRKEEMAIFLRVLFSQTFWIGLFCATLILLASPLIAHFLKLPNTIPVIFLGLIIFFSGVSPVITGTLQGLQMFLWLAVASVISTLIKPLFAFWFIQRGLMLTGALDAFLVSTIMVFLISLIPLRLVITPLTHNIKINLKEKFQYIIPVGITALCIALLTNIDMVLVKHYFNPLEAGFYSVSQMIGKIVLFLPSPIAFVMFPKTASLYAKEEDSKQLLKKTLLLTFALCFVAILVYNLLPGLILKILTGKSDPACIILGRIFSMNMMLFALLNVFFSYHLSVSDFRFIKALIISTIFQIVLIVFIHQTLITVLLVIAGNSLALLFYNMQLAFRKRL